MLGTNAKLTINVLAQANPNNPLPTPEEIQQQVQTLLQTNYPDPPATVTLDGK